MANGIIILQTSDIVDNIISISKISEMTIGALLAFFTAYVIYFLQNRYNKIKRLTIGKKLLKFYISQLIDFIEKRQIKDVDIFDLEILNSYIDSYYDTLEYEKAHQTFIRYYLLWKNNAYDFCDINASSIQKTAKTKALFDLKELLKKH